MRRRLVAAIAVSTLACGPSVRALVADRHYREAVCAADEGREAELVGRALDSDANIVLHAQVIDGAEVRAALSGPEVRSGRVGLTGRDDGDAVLLRISAQSDTLPIDTIELSVIAGALDGRAVALGTSWGALAWATGEPLPPRRLVDTYITGANALRAGAALMTAGLSLLFTRFRSETVSADPLPADYERVAPRASRLHALTSRAGCFPHESGAAGGVRCEWFFVYASRSDAPLAVVLTARYAADRTDPEHTLRSVCAVTRRAHFTLGARATLAADLDARFGPRSRALRELAEAGPEPPVSMWEHLQETFSRR